MVTEELDFMLPFLRASYFDEISTYLSFDMTVFIYGVGSKYKFLNAFTQKLKNNDIIIVNGYHFQEKLSSWRRVISREILEYLTKQ